MQYNEGDIQKHLKKLTSRWSELGEDAYFEIRCIKEQGMPAWKKFTRDQMQAAIQFATKQNAEKYNVYVTVNPISKNSNGRASRDEDVLASFYCFCDCDTEESVMQYNKVSTGDVKGNFGVYTGQKPKRGHIYYELDKPIKDMETWSTVQRGIAEKLHSDPVVNNPSRIMRLAGTVNYPNKKKELDGRVVELSEFKNFRSDIKTIQALKKFFPYKTHPEFRINFDDFTQRERIDTENSIRQIKAGNNWHDNMIRVVASLVARGRTDYEIHQALSDITLSGYTLDDTTREINVAIEGARSKGFTGTERQSISSLIDTSVDVHDMFLQWTYVNPLTHPKREFLYGNHYVKDYYSVTVAPGGVGKSTLVMTEVLSMVTGKPLLGIEPNQKCKVMYFNAEDPLEEVQRRILALCQYYEIPQEDISNLYYGSGRRTNMTLMAGNAGLINEMMFQELVDTIKKNKIDLIVIDPLAAVISSQESVEHFRNLANELAALADKGNCSVELVHHTRKLQSGQEATIEDSRGGSSLIAGSRSGRVLRNMSKREGEELGIEKYVDYFKIEPAGKSNLSRPLDKEQWYKKIGVQIPNSDWVAVVEKYNVPTAFDGISVEKCGMLWDAIRSEERYLMSHIATKPNEYKISVQQFMAEFLDMDIDAPSTRTRIRSMLTTWLKSGVLVEKEVSLTVVEPKSYRPKTMVKIIEVGDIKPGV